MLKEYYAKYIDEEEQKKARARGYALSSLHRTYRERFQEETYGPFYQGSIYGRYSQGIAASYQIPQAALAGIYQQQFAAIQTQQALANQQGGQSYWQQNQAISIASPYGGFTQGMGNSPSKNGKTKGGSNGNG